MLLIGSQPNVTNLYKMFCFIFRVHFLYKSLSSHWSPPGAKNVCYFQTVAIFLNHFFPLFLLC